MTPEENEMLTRVGSGTPGGEMLRRYWWPVWFEEKIEKKPIMIRLLGETFVLFRDGSGKIGMLDHICSHRRASLEFGRVGYAVLNYGSFMGMGGKLFALPWDILKYDTRHDAYVIGIPEEKLKNAPSFDSGAWPNMGDPAWGKEIHDYYGSSADWYLSGY